MLPSLFKKYLANILLAIMSLTFFFGLSQSFEYNRYYRVNTIEKRSKVRESIYTSESFPYLNTINVYDSLGREILWYYTNDDTKNYTKFIQSKDTLIEVQYDSVANTMDAPFRVEKYLYSKDRKILLYATCDSGISGDKVEARLVEFYYDKNGKVRSCLYYSAENYPFRVDKKVPVIKSLFTLSNVEVFYYNQISQMTLKKQMIGSYEHRFTDSFFYDKQSRLIKQVTFQKEGYVGEIRRSNISYITSFNYTDSSVIETKIVQYENYDGTLHRDGERTYEYVKNNNGLTERIYFINNEKKTLSGTYRHTYFK